MVLDFYGGAAHVPLKDYFNATLKDLTNVVSANAVPSVIQIRDSTDWKLIQNLLILAIVTECVFNSQKVILY